MGRQVVCLLFLVVNDCSKFLSSLIAETIVAPDSPDMLNFYLVSVIKAALNLFQLQNSLSLFRGIKMHQISYSVVFLYRYEKVSFSCTISQCS